MHPVVHEHVMNFYVPNSCIQKNKNKMIIENGPEAKKYVKTAEGVYDEVLFVEPNQIGLRFSLAIFGDKTAFFSYDPADLCGVVIENQLIAQGMIGIYQFMANLIKAQQK
jgi:hypothetical protein